MGKRLIIEVTDNEGVSYGAQVNQLQELSWEVPENHFLRDTAKLISSGRMKQMLILPNPDYKKDEDNPDTLSYP